LDIQEIPVLLERKENSYSLVKGESAIEAYLTNLDLSGRGSANSPTDHSSDLRGNNLLIPQAGNQAEGCSVSTDCDPIPSLPVGIPDR